MERTERTGLSLERLFSSCTLRPRIEKIGFETIAFTVVKSRFTNATFEEKEKAGRKGKEWIMRQPNVILAMSGQGIG